MADFTTAVERLVAGSEKRSRVLNPLDRRRVAYHEMGHALAAATLPGTDPVHKVSIIPRSIGALGYTMQRPTEDNSSSPPAISRIAWSCLWQEGPQRTGSSAKSTSAADDLVRTTDIARQIVTRFGMSKNLGQAVFERQSSAYLGENMMGVKQKDYSEETAREIDLAVKQLIDEAYTRAKDILKTRAADLEAGTKILLEKENITPEDFAPLRQVSTAAAAPPARRKSPARRASR